MEMVKVEKFTTNRYSRYLKKGIQMRLFDKRGKEWTVKEVNCGRDNKEVLVEHHYYNEHLEKDCTDTFFFNEDGSGWYRDQLYIMQGIGDIQKGDLVISKRTPESTFFFYEIYTGLCRCENSLGYGTHWSCDCHGGQINLAHLHNALTGCLKHEAYLRKATAEEKEQFYKYLLAGGYGYNPDECCLYDVPTVGTEYWSVEPDESGLMKVVHHEAPKTEEERPFNKRNSYTWEQSAIERAEKINEVIYHGKLS